MKILWTSEGATSPCPHSFMLELPFFPDSYRQEKRVDKATLEMEPEYPPRYFDDLAKDLCTSEGHAESTM